MKRTILISTLVLISLIGFAGCKGSTDSSASTSASDDSESGLSAGTTTAYNTSSTVDTSVYSNVVYVNLTDGKWSTDNSTFNSITTDDAECYSGLEISYTTDALDEATGLIKIDGETFGSEFAVYISGTTTAGGVKIQTDGTNGAAVYLNDATITSGTYAPVSVTKGGAATVYISGTNTLADGRAYGTAYEDDFKGSLYSKGAMIIKGSGTLTVNQSYKNCIGSATSITVNGGTFNLTSNGKNGYACDGDFTYNDGTTTFNGTGAVSTSTLRKANGINSDANVVINGGTLSLTEYDGKGITAETVSITGGTVTVASTGVTGFTSDDNKRGTYTDADGNSVTGSIVFAAEGIEGTSSVTISGGTVSVTATDDGINVSSSSGVCTISGGSVYVKASGGDGIDCNGNIAISGGTVVSIALTGSEDAFDCGDSSNTITISGGYVAGTSGSSNGSSDLVAGSNQHILYKSGSSSSGGNTPGSQGGSGGMNHSTINASSTSTSTSVYGVTYNSSPAMAYTVPSTSFGLLVLSCPDFKLSTSSYYSLYSGCSTSTLGTATNGLYTSPTSISGTSGSSFSIK